jgi:glycosyltransferase involved in cell wall biosynthesis
MTKLLIYNSNKFSGGTVHLLEKIFYGLAENNAIIYYGVEKHSAESRLISKASYKKYRPKLLINKNSWLVFLLAPFLFLKYFIQILVWKIKGVEKIICFGLTEKIFTFIPAKIFGLKIFWVEWEILPFFYKKSYWRFWYLFFGKKITIITAVEKIKQQLVKLKLKAEQITNIYPGIEAKKFLQNDLINQFANSEIFRIGTICKLEQNKGVELLIRAVKNGLQFIPNLRLTIVGDGKERKSLIWLAKQLEIADYIQFSGFQSSVNSWIKSFEAFVYPSMIEKTFSLTVLQAMAYGKPAIVFETGALPEFVENMKNGIVVKKGDVAELTQAIVYLHRNAQEKEQMGEAGKKLILQKYDLDRMVEEWKKIIK